MELLPISSPVRLHITPNYAPIWPPFSLFMHRLSSTIQYCIQR
uniref:Uncharacterized protein n=1 Tax=Anguilla anguilla TaxID=7936 RepID=A0A0E9QH11_ANGAN